MLCLDDGLARAIAERERALAHRCDQAFRQPAALGDCVGERALLQLRQRFELGRAFGLRKRDQSRRAGERVEHKLLGRAGPELGVGAPMGAYVEIDGRGDRIARALSFLIARGCAFVCAAWTRGR